MHRIKQYRKDLQDWLHGIRTTEPNPLTYGISIDIAQLVVNHERNLYLNNKTYVQPPRHNAVFIRGDHDGDQHPGT